MIFDLSNEERGLLVVCLVFRNDWMLEMTNGTRNLPETQPLINKLLCGSLESPADPVRNGQHAGSTISDCEAAVERAEKASKP